MASFGAEMGHVDPCDGIACEYPQEIAGVEPQKTLSRTQDRQGALLPDDIKQYLAPVLGAGFIVLRWIVV